MFHASCPPTPNSRFHVDYIWHHVSLAGAENPQLGCLLHSTGESPGVHRVWILWRAATSMVVVQTVNHLFLRFGDHEIMRRDSDSLCAIHQHIWRLGPALDGGKYSSTNILCDAAVPSVYERFAVLYH